MRLPPELNDFSILDPHFLPTNDDFGFGLVQEVGLVGVNVGDVVWVFGSAGQVIQTTDPKLDGAIVLVDLPAGLLCHGSKHVAVFFWCAVLKFVGYRQKWMGIHLQ